MFTLKLYIIIYILFGNYVYSNEIILNSFNNLQDSLGGFNENGCVKTFEKVVLETKNFNKVINEYSKLNNNGDTTSQFNYINQIIKGKCDALTTEASYLLDNCKTRNLVYISGSESIYSDFLLEWSSSFKTMEYVYKNNIYNKKRYNITENIIDQNSNNLKKPFYNFKDCNEEFCPDLIVIPNGEYLMGGNIMIEKPRHTVNIKKSFAIGKFEVTLKQFKEFLKEAGHIVPNGCIDLNINDLNKKIDVSFSNKINYNNPHGLIEPPNENEPITCLRKEDCKLFLRWLSAKTNQTYRLPTEAEWEYVANSNEITENNICKFENIYDIGATKKYGNYFNYQTCNDNSISVSKVGSYLPNKFGLYDIIGNVKEYVDDCWHFNFNNAPSDGSIWNDSNNGLCAYSIVKGGSWGSEPRDIRTSYRNTLFSSQSKSTLIGFRVVREI